MISFSRTLVILLFTLCSMPILGSEHNVMDRSPFSPNFVLNRSGNILIATTGSQTELPEEIRAEFSSVIAFLHTMAKALHTQGLDLRSPQQMETILLNSGYFIETECEEYEVNKKKRRIRFPFLRRRKQNQNAGEVKEGHILFILEYLLGISTISVELTYFSDGWRLNPDSGKKEQLELMRKKFLYVGGMEN